MFKYMNKRNHSRSILLDFLNHIYASSSSVAPVAAVTNFNYSFRLVVVLFAALLLLPYAAGQSTNRAPPPSEYGWNPEFNPSMAIFVVVMISAFFFLGFFAIYVRQCVGSEGRNGGSVRPTTNIGRSRRGKRGLDPDVIETFPMFNYADVKEHKIGKGALECAVCLNEFEDDETLRLLPKCDHVFHPECIDAWLVAHVTCPVCRANLKPELIQVTDGAAQAEAVEVSDSDNESDQENNNGNSNNAQEAENQVSISVSTDEDQQQQQQQPNQIPIQNRPVRSASTGPRITGKFPRSHSTGHSLVQPGENCDRFTLRLPDDVRKQIVNGKLNRTTSCLAYPIGDGSVSGGSVRGGHRSSGEGSSRGRTIRLGRTDRNVRSDRWVFSRAPPFFMRTSSVKSFKLSDGDGSIGGTGSSSTTFPKALRNSVVTPLDCLGAKGEGSGQSSAVRPPV